MERIHIRIYNTSLILSLSKDEAVLPSWFDKLTMRVCVFSELQRESANFLAAPPQEDCQKKWVPVFRFGNPTTKKGR